MLNELQKFKVQSILVLEYRKRNDCKIFHSIAKLIASYSDIKGTFRFVHQKIIMKIQNYASEDWVVLDAIMKHSIKIFEC